MQHHTVHSFHNRSAEKDLREKLLQEELKNLEETLDRIQSLGFPTEGLWDSVKNAVNKATDAVKGMVFSTPEVKTVYNAIEKKYKPVNIQDGVISFTANSKSVQVKQDGGKWHINVENGGWFPVKDINDLLVQIDVRTQDAKSMSSASRAQQVVMCSRAIIGAQRCGF